MNLLFSVKTCYSKSMKHAVHTTNEIFRIRGAFAYGFFYWFR